MKTTAGIGPSDTREPPASLRASYDARRARSFSAVRAAIAELQAHGRRVTLASIERVSQELPEGKTTAKTVLRNPECRALYDAAAGRITRHKGPQARRALRVELATTAEVAGAGDDGVTTASTDPPSAAELRRAQRLDRRSKRELAAMVIRLEREVAALGRHNANLRERLLQDILGHDGRGRTKPAVSSSGCPASRP